MSVRARPAKVSDTFGVRHHTHQRVARPAKRCQTPSVSDTEGSSSLERDFQNASTPTAAATPSAIALLFGFFVFGSTVGFALFLAPLAASFAAYFAARLP